MPNSEISRQIKIRAKDSRLMRLAIPERVVEYDKDNQPIEAIELFVAKEKKLFGRKRHFVEVAVDTPEGRQRFVGNKAFLSEGMKNGQAEAVVPDSDEYSPVVLNNFQGFWVPVIMFGILDENLW